jgi:hypothetical protein
MGSAAWMRCRARCSSWRTLRYSEECQWGVAGGDGDGDFGARISRHSPSVVSRRLQRPHALGREDERGGVWHVTTNNVRCNACPTVTTSHVRQCCPTRALHAGGRGNQEVAVVVVVVVVVVVMVVGQ